MNTAFCKRLSFFARRKADKHVPSPVKSNRLTLLAISPLVATMLCVASPARADNYSFSINGSGITASGTLQVSKTGPFGASTVTGINGTFTDSANNFSGAISGPNFALAPVTDGVDTYFSSPAFTTAGFSYDNLFWADGHSPAVCVDAPVFSGGDFDIYGLSFNIAGGYTVDLWSNGPGLGGYQLNDSLHGTPFVTPNMDGLAYAVDFAASPVPEPSSLLLLGTGMTGFFTLLSRKRTV